MEPNQEVFDITEAIKQAVQTEKIYLFGSHAYGNPNEDSDYDFYLVIPDGGARPIDVMQKAYRSLLHVNRTTAVDILANYSSSFRNRRELNTLERKIYREGVLLYG